MTLPRALLLTAAVVASTSAVYGLSGDDWAGGVVVGLLAVLVVSTVLRAVQAAEAREWRLAHEADHAADRRDLAAIRDTAEAARATAVRAASEKTAEVVDLRHWVRDHDSDPDAHRRPARVNGERKR